MFKNHEMKSYIINETHFFVFQELKEYKIDNRLYRRQAVQSVQWLGYELDNQGLTADRGKEFLPCVCACVRAHMQTTAMPPYSLSFLKYLALAADM
jgi:hypothetical protein